MVQSRQPKVSLEDQLGLLAMRFRGTRDEAARDDVVARYGQVVRRLIDRGKWREMPSFEEMLPSDRMPEEFYVFWSIPSPIERTLQEPGRPTLILEGQDEVTILKAVLPPRVSAVCKLWLTERHPAVVEAARTHVAKHHAPVAILFDANTRDKQAAGKAVAEIKEKLALTAGATPFGVFCFVPHVEDIFFHGGVDFRRIFPDFKAVFDRELARTNPKRQLKALLEKGRGPKNLSSFLDQLTREEEEEVCHKPPLPKVVAFIVNNLPLANGG